MIVVGIVMDILYRDCEAILNRLQSDRPHDLCPFRRLVGDNFREVIVRAADRVEALREQHLARIGLEQGAGERILNSNA